MSDPTRNAAVASNSESLIELAPGVRIPAGAGVLSFAFSRSGGPGGQNVNKVATKAELRLRIADLPGVVNERARTRLRKLAGKRLVRGADPADDELVIVSESERSQARNKSECLEKLRELLVNALAEPKVRRKTKPSRGSKERRLEGKRVRSKIKRGRSGGERE
jgi:ribosome-associated protein